MSFLQASVVLGAAFAGGMINSVAGGGTLLTFPALVWIGRDPIMANATSTMALWPGTFASVVGFRRDLRGTAPWMVLLGLPSLAGGLIGAALLLRTSSHTFGRIAPYLVFGATLLLAGRDVVARMLPARADRRPKRGWWAGAMLFQFFVALYGGYFGAGIGILMLASLALLGLDEVYQMSGLKNFFAALINGVAAAYFVLSGAVIWFDALLMMFGAIAGGYGGAGVARRVGPRAVRVAVLVIGLAMSLSLFLLRH